LLFLLCFIGPAGLLLMKKLAVLLSQLLLPFSAFAANYYVTQSGAGRMKKLLFVLLLIISTVQAKTQVYTGTVNGITINTGGTATAPLVVDCTQATLTGPINFNGVSYVTVNGGKFSSNVQNACFTFTGQSDHITIQNASFTGVAGSNTNFIAWGAASNGLGNVTNLLVQNCTADSCGGFVNGSDKQSHDITVLNNFMRTSTNTSRETDVFKVADASNVVIQGNEIIQNAPGSGSSGRHNDCIQTFTDGSSGSAPGVPSNWTICYNWIELSEVGGDGNNSWTMLENMGANVQIFSNVFVCDVSDPGNGVTFDSCNSGHSVYFYNNTMVALHGGPSNVCRFLVGNSPNTLFARNNILVTSPSYGGTTADWTYTAGAPWDYNFFFPNGANGSYCGTHGSINVNPMLAANYSLAAGSPLIGAGDNKIGAAYNQGIAPGATWPNPALVTRTSSWDIGAFQSGVISAPAQVQNFRQMR
jgi:hypothetical protein